MARRKPHAGRALRNGLEEVAEPLTLVPPRIHRLAKQCYVSCAPCDEVLYLPDHTPHRTADHSPPHRRDYAVAALIIAPGHYRDEGVVLALRARQLRRVRLPHRRQSHELRLRLSTMPAQYEVYKRGPLKTGRLLIRAHIASKTCSLHA